MVKFRHIIRLVVLLEILYMPATIMAGELQKTKNLHIVFDLINGELLVQDYGSDTYGNNLNYYRSIPDFRTTSIRSMNRNGQQYTELTFMAENPDDPLLLAHIFTYFLARECMLRYDRDNDTLNLIINNAGGMRVNSFNGRDLFSPVDKQVPMLMFVWPGDAEIFEIDVSLNE